MDGRNIMDSTGLGMKPHGFGGTLFRRREGKHIYSISAVPVCDVGHYYFHIEATEVPDPRFAISPGLYLIGLKSTESDKNVLRCTIRMLAIQET